MKTGRSIIELATEIQRQTESRKDYLAPTTKMMAVADERYAGDEQARLDGLNGASLGITSHAHGQLAGETDIPLGYYRRMKEQAPALWAQNVNHWLHAERRERMVRTLDGRVRAVLSNRYRTLDNIDLTQAVLPPLVEKGCSLASAELTETRLYLKFTLASMQMEVKGSRQKGDVVEAGLVISNSEVGSGMVRVEPMIHRLVCLNGMIAPDSTLRKYHVGKAFDAEANVRELLTDETRQKVDAAFWASVRDVAVAAFTQEVFQKLVEKMAQATEDRIAREASLEKVVEVTDRRLNLGLSQGEGKSILSFLIEGGDLSRYGLLNAVTAASQEQESYDRATELERAGGRILELAPRDWQVIASAN